MRPKISIGMVGVGQFGKCFIKPFRDHPDVARIALCDIKADRLADRAKEFGISETYDSLDEICRSDLDALVIITQPWLHAPQAIQAMEAGKHVYSAVPTMYDHDGDVILDWCDKLVDAAKRTGQIYMMGETSYYLADVVYCRKKAQEGAFGEIAYIEAEYLHDTRCPICDLIEVAMARTGKTAAEVIETGGGVPMHYPTHSSAVPISITGAHMTEVAAFGYEYPNDEYYRRDSVSGNTFGNETAIYRMSNGTVARLCEYRRVGHTNRDGIVQLLGTDASFERDRESRYFVNKSDWEAVDVDAYRDQLPDVLAADLGGHGGSHAYLVHEFVDACVNERTPTVNAWEAARYVAAGVTAHKSALRGGELLKVPDWGDAPERP
jgi:predicted dehydrogenase